MNPPLIPQYDPKTEIATLSALNSIHAMILNELNVGITVVDGNTNVLFWNRFLEVYSGYPATEIQGENLYSIFPDLNRQWLERKLQSVWLLKSNSYISWKNIRTYFVFGTIDQLPAILSICIKMSHLFPW